MTIHQKPKPIERKAASELHSRKLKKSKPSKSQPSGATQSISFEDPGNAFDLLARHFPWPITMFAVMAAWNIGWSGSESLELWTPGYGSSEGSDLDFFTPSTAGGLLDICHAFNFAEIQWNNYIVRKVEMLKKQRTIIIPSAMILSLAILLGAKSSTRKDAQAKKLHDYLKRSIERSGNWSVMAKLFIGHFCEKVNEYRELSGNWKKRWDGPSQSAIHVKSRVWIFHTGDDLPSQAEHRIEGMEELLSELHFIFQEIPQSIFTVSTIRECLAGIIPYRWPPVTTVGNEFTFEDGEEKAVLLPRPTPPSTMRLRQDWSNKSLNDDMLVEYLKFMLISKWPHHSQLQVHMAVREALQLDGDGPEQPYGDDFRIMSGTLPNKKKVQIVFDKKNDRHPLYTVLQFYATHVMQGICGTAGVHLYHSTAKKLQSLELDFHGDDRQHRAKLAITTKYEPKGWKFQDMDRGATHSRNMSDSKTRMVDFEPLYAAALSEVREGQNMPEYITSFFTWKRKELKSLTWNERYGRIPKNEIHSDYTNGANYGRGSKIRPTDRMEGDKGACFVKWIHETLSGHKYVVPRDKWEKQDIFDAKLDIFFAGFHSDP